MNHEFFTNLPPEITINILSRLPILTAMTCKFVCKSWLELLETPEFVKSHLCNSVPGLVVFLQEFRSELFKIYEFEDKLDLKNHELHYNPITEFDCRAFTSPSDKAIGIYGSFNGLLFLRAINPQPDAFYICNPITREYIHLPSPDDSVYYYPTIVTYGFGVSKTTGQYKAVRIYHECTLDPQAHAILSIPKFVCKVYTLGTGSWTSIASSCAQLVYSCRSVGAFLYGNLHWFVAELKGSFRISCFDLETETFSTFSPPPSVLRMEKFLVGLVALGDRLCLCDNTSEDEIVIWLMMEYGDEKSWRKEFVISKLPDFGGECYEVVYPIKVFKDGDILMVWDDFHLFYYSNKTKTTRRIDMFELQTIGRIEATLHTSSFLSLKRFGMENVKSF